MFEFLTIRETRLREESRHQRQLELMDRRARINAQISERRQEFLNKYHVVGMHRDTGIVNLIEQDGKSVGECTIIWVLHENGLGARKWTKDFQGHDPNYGWSHLWHKRPEYENVLNWTYRSPETTIKTTLPPNADVEDQMWDKLGLGKA